MGEFLEEQKKTPSERVISLGQARKRPVQQIKGLEEEGRRECKEGKSVFSIGQPA